MMDKHGFKIPCEYLIACKEQREQKIKIRRRLKMYRPPKWNKAVHDNTDWKDRESVEVGADLMLRELRAEPAIRLNNKIAMIEHYLIKIKDLPDGVWRVLLIPEEEQNDNG